MPGLRVRGSGFLANIVPCHDRSRRDSYGMSGAVHFDHLLIGVRRFAAAVRWAVVWAGFWAGVAAATEQHPDAYLLKPITATDIEERLKVMLDKRDALLAIHTKLSKDDLVGALAECDAVLAQKNRWTMSAMQTKGSVLLKLGRHEEAKAIYRAALDVRSDLTWARLGLARAHKAAGQFQEAQMLARDIIESRDGDKNVAAYDVIAESLEALGDPEGAMWVLRDAAQVVPSARRQRLLGESAYRNGDLDTAKDALGKATRSSKGSVMSLPQDTLLLAQTMVDLGEAQDALKVIGEGQANFRNAPAFGNVALAIQAQAEAATGATDQAAKTLARARETMRKGKADFATVALAKAEACLGLENGSQALAVAMTKGVLESGSFGGVSAAYDAVSEKDVTDAFVIMQTSNPSLAAVGDLSYVPYHASILS